MLLALTLIPKDKKTLETSLDLTPSFKTSLDARVEGLVLNLDYLGNLRSNFIQKKYGRKDIWRAHKFHPLECNFSSFCITDFLHR